MGDARSMAVAPVPMSDGPVDVGLIEIDQQAYSD